MIRVGEFRPDGLAKMRMQYVLFVQESDEAAESGRIACGAATGVPWARRRKSIRSIGQSIVIECRF